MPAHLPGPIIACEVLRDEITALGAGERTIFLEQGLHRMPERLHAELAARMKELERKSAPPRITLAFGLCGGALAGLCARRARLLLPRVHDCLGLLLNGQPGPVPPGRKACYYLSPGWVRYSRHPLAEHAHLVERHGREAADWVCKELFKAYGSLALIDTVPAPPEVEAVWRATAERFGLAPVRLKGDLSLLAALLRGEAGDQAVLLEPGKAVSAGLFGLPDAAFPQTSGQID